MRRRRAAAWHVAVARKGVSGASARDVPIRDGHVVVRIPRDAHRTLLPGRWAERLTMRSTAPASQRHVLVLRDRQDILARPGRDRPAFESLEYYDGEPDDDEEQRMKLGLHVARFTYPGGAQLADDLRRI